jgi:predicted enzyme related to lactoylglutathione lyase
MARTLTSEASMSHPVHQALSYIEFGVTDLDAARAFYESAFGWQFNDYGPEYAGIRSADGEEEIGGLSTFATPSAQGPLVLLFSTDLDASVTAVTEAGGAIVAGPYDFPGGRRFEFADPSGNRLGVFAEA